MATATPGALIGEETTVALPFADNCVMPLLGLLLAFTIQAQQATVRIVGSQTVALTAADLSAMPRTSVQVNGVTYEGVRIRELLTKAGVLSGEGLRGAELAKAVVVTGADGYQVAFGLAEFDPDFTDRVSILADRRDGNPLPANALPFQLVLAGEKRPARWVRQVVSIEVRPLSSK
jgi:hypothetical protein